MISGNSAGCWINTQPTIPILLYDSSGLVSVGRQLSNGPPTLSQLLKLFWVSDGCSTMNVGLPTPRRWRRVGRPALARRGHLRTKPALAEGPQPSTAPTKNAAWEGTVPRKSLRNNFEIV